MGTSKVLKRKVDEAEDEMFTDTENCGGSSGKEQNLKGGEMGGRFGASVFVSGDDVREKDSFPITDETHLMGEGKKIEREKGDGRSAKDWNSV